VRPDSGALVWPEDAPLDGISSLPWPDKPTGPGTVDADTSDFALPDHPLAGFAEGTDNIDSDEAFRLPEPEQVLGASASTESMESTASTESMESMESMESTESTESTASETSTESMASETSTESMESTASETSTASEIKRRADEELARLKAALLKEEFRQGS
jgi:hypothetical protein